MEKDCLPIQALDILAHSPAKSENRRWMRAPRMRAPLAALSVLVILLALAVPQNRSFGVLANVDFDAEFALELNDDTGAGESPPATASLASFALASSDTDIVRLATEGQTRLRLRHRYSPSDPRGPPIRA